MYATTSWMRVPESCRVTPRQRRQKNCRTQTAAAPAALVTGNNSHGHCNRSLFLSLRRGAVYTVPTAMQMHSVTVKNWVDRHTDCSADCSAPCPTRRLYIFGSDCIKFGPIFNIRSSTDFAVTCNNKTVIKRAYCTMAQARRYGKSYGRLCRPRTQWRKDGVAAASSDGGLTGGS